MQHFRRDTAESYLKRMQPDAPVLFLDPQVLAQTAQAAREAFDGLVTYAVKANPGREVLQALVEGGVRSFDVASPQEMAAVRSVCPEAVLHYNNPVRSLAEIEAGIEAGVASWSVDCHGELDKLSAVPRDAEIAVRFALPVKGAAYDFGAKFGAAPELAADLLKRAAQMGVRPALCFHPGTQCDDASVWARYIRAARDIAEMAGVRIKRLNLGGGFAAHRSGSAPCLPSLLTAASKTTREVFGEHVPDLLCEPGRSMVAEAGTLAVRVKSLRDNSIYLNDGIYGTLADLRDMPPPDRVEVISPEGEARTGSAQLWDVFGPTCDSLDRLPDGWSLPCDLSEEDYLVIRGMGAYTVAMATAFNGYGQAERILL